MRAHTRSVFTSLAFLLLFLIAGTATAVGSLSGVITDHSSGAPLQGIGITLFRSEDPNSADRDAWIFVQSGSSNSDGEYRFSELEPWRYHVHVGAQTDNSGKHFVRSDLYNVQVFDNTETPDMDLQLREAGYIWGYVTTESGTPIPGATVHGHGERLKEGPGWYTAYTDNTGLYRIWALPSPGEFYVVSTWGAILGNFPDLTGYESAIAPGLYQATIQGVRGPDFVLAEGGCITGRIVNEQGSGIENVEVRPRVGILDIQWVRTGPDGSYFIAPLPATDQAYVYIETGDLHPVILNGVKYGSGERFVGPLTVTAGTCAQAPDMVMLPSGSIQGVVTDTAGTPIVGVDVEVHGFDSEGDLLEAVEHPLTDALGQYTRDYIPPGEYTVSAIKDGWVAANRSGVVVVSGEPTDLDLVMHRADQATSVSGRVVDFQSNTCQKDSTGTLLPYYLDNQGEIDSDQICDNGIVAFPGDYLYRPQEPFMFLGFSDIDDGYADYFQTDPTENPGDYRLALPPGGVEGLLYTYHNTDRGEHVVIHGRLRWNLVEGEHLAGQDFRMPPVIDTGVLEGVINYPADADFNPHKTVILAFNEETPTNSSLGDAFAWPYFAPAYRIGHLPAGRYTLRALSDGFVDRTYEGVVVTSGANRVQDITLETGATLDGLITDAVSGLPLAGARVEITDNGKRGVSDDTGAYQVRGLAPDDYSLLVTKPGYAAFSGSVTVSLPATSYDIALDSQAGSITGSVIDENAAAVNNALVVAYNPVLNSHKSEHTVGGDFTIGDLPAGDYVLGIMAPGYATVQHPPSGTLTLSASQALVIADPIVVSLTGPLFDSSSSVSESAGVITLEVSISSDLSLPSPPSIVSRGQNTTDGCVSFNWQQITASHYLASCVVAPGESLVWIDIAEGAVPVISGNPASASFSFEVSSNLLSTATTNFFNAIGSDSAIMGTQDQTQVYIPPFALAGADTQAVKLTVKRYGDPGDATTNNDDRSVSAVYDFSFEDDQVRIDTNHRATITLQFEKPADMSQADFEADLRVGYFRVSDQQWVYQTDPSSGIDNIHINWLNSTITFDTSHFTRFAAFLPTAPSTTGDYDGDGDVDRDDLDILLQDRNKTVDASNCGVACDLDGDGTITVSDARKLVLICSRARCATE